MQTDKIYASIYHYHVTTVHNVTPIEHDVLCFHLHCIYRMLFHTAHSWLQFTSKHVFIGLNCALQRITGNAVLAVDLCLQNSIKTFLSLTFSSLAFSSLAFSSDIFQSCIFRFCIFSAHIYASSLCPHVYLGVICIMPKEIFIVMQMLFLVELVKYLLKRFYCS